MTLRVIPLRADGTLDLDALEQLLQSPRQGSVRLVCVTHVSNVLGMVNPVERIIEIAHVHDVPVLVDGAQSTPHFKVDVQALNCDFFAFSGHKIYGPTGVGVLYGKKEYLEQMPPYQGGGEMIKNVSFEHTTYNDLPYKFEAGTPDYVGTHALAVALDYISAIGMDCIHQYEVELTRYALERLSQIPDIHIYGYQKEDGIYVPQSKNGVNGSSVISFNVGKIHHLDIGTLLDRLGIAVRTGHHCAEPLMHLLGIEGTVRASLAFYNTPSDIDALIAALRRVIQMF